MADPPRYPNSDDTDLGSDRESTTGVPRWVKVTGVVVAVLALLVVAVILFDIGGEHGPGRHGPSGNTPTSVVTDDGGHTPPAGGHG